MTMQTRPLLHSVTLPSLSVNLSKKNINVYMYLFVLFFTERITQSIVKSHLETCQYSAEDMKRFTWAQYTPEETRAFQSKVRTTAGHHSITHKYQLYISQITRLYVLLVSE